MKIVAQNLSVGYDSKRILNELNLHIESGEFFTLLGPSGCGKTTLLRAIAGFASIEKGQLFFGAQEVTHTPAYKRNIGMVFQDYALFPDKSVYDNVAFGLRARKMNENLIQKQVNESLERVGLTGFGERKPAALSGGQRQRVALARALVIKPDVLLMDEPLSNLDAKLRHSVRETIVDLQRETGITTLFVTHDQDEALAMSSRIGLMKAGQLTQIGTPQEIYTAPNSSYVADFIGAANIFEVHNNNFEGLTLALEHKKKLILRPENVRFNAQSPLKARITAKQYLGAKTSYTLRLPSNRILRVDYTGEGHDTYALQDSVGIEIKTFRGVDE